ncbi:acyl-CoA thioesterase [Rhodosalinus sp.]|uniref:acyl-CoA thioesterase n=1 Tax=Rhodosalinus sp. TaxID=2047741 RepID=UPI003567ADB0
MTGDSPPDHVLRVAVTFGDCDPAGIVFYPTFFRWFDRCFHDFLFLRAGGHAALCERLGSAGLGLMEADARFRAPVRENETLVLGMRASGWHAKAVRLDYTGHVGERLAVVGHELRGVFLHRDGRMTAGEVAPLRAALRL